MLTTAIVTHYFGKQCNCAFFILIIILHFRNHGSKRPIAAFNVPIDISMLPDRTLILGPSAQTEMSMLSPTFLARHGPHKKRRLQQFFVAAGTFLPSFHLATIEWYTDTHVQQFFYCCVHSLLRDYMYIEPLPSNEWTNTIYRPFA
jgi:hypothetical protein